MVIEDIKNSSVDYKNQSLEEQLFRLIASYAYNNTNVYAQLANTTDGIEDFMSFAYTHLLSELLPKWDPEKGSLSTYVYSTLDYLYPVFIAQAKYQVSFSMGRKLTSSTRLEQRDKYKEIYVNKSSIDTCSTILMTNKTPKDNNNDSDTQIPDSSLADPNSNIEKYEEDEFNQDILKIFDSCLDRYFDRPSTVKDNIERNKEIIKTYTLNRQDSTLQNIGNKYNLSRERVRQICDKFYRWASKDKELRSVLGL